MVDKNCSVAVVTAFLSRLRLPDADKSIPFLICFEMKRWVMMLQTMETAAVATMATPNGTKVYLMPADLSYHSKHLEIRTNKAEYSA